MTDLSELSNYVLEQIKATPEYIEYRNTLDELRKSPELYEQVNELREKNFQLHNSENENLLELMDALTNEYEDVIGISVVSDFIEAEAAFCKIMQQFNFTVTNGLEFD